MNDLNPKARALLDATHLADDPSDDDFERVHASLARQLAVGVAGVAASAAVATVARTAAAANGVAASSASTAVGASTAAGTLTSAAVASAPALKVAAWVLALSVTAGVGATAVVVSGVVSHAKSAPVGASPVVGSATPNASPSDSASTAASAAASTARAPRLTLNSVAATPRLAAAPTVQVDPGAPPPPVASNTPSAFGALNTANPRVAAVPSASAASLEAEVALIRDARLALQKDDAAHALAILDDHARRFPAGAMTEDRDALQVFASCAAGQADVARELSSRFLLRHASSPYASSVRASCSP